MRYQEQKDDLNAMARIYSNVQMSGEIILPSLRTYKRLTKVREIVLNEDKSKSLISKLRLLPYRVTVGKKKIQKSA